MFSKMFDKFGSTRFNIVLRLLLLIQLVFKLSHEDISSSCNFDLSESEAQEKIVHRFRTSCTKGEIHWRYPLGGLELTFDKPPVDDDDDGRRHHVRDHESNRSDQSTNKETYDSYSPEYRVENEKIVGDGDDDDDDLYKDGDDAYQFCYVITVHTANVRLSRETAGPKFSNLTQPESCISAESLMANYVKFYAEATPSLSSSLVGKFQLLYRWSKATPFELCRPCSREELLYSTCTAGHVFTGKVLNSHSLSKHLTISITDINRFNKHNPPKKLCVKNARHEKAGAVLHSMAEENHSLFRHLDCDEIRVQNRGKCYMEDVKKHLKDDFFFLADTDLERMRLTCLMPLKHFQKLWYRLEEEGETQCSL